MLRRNFGFVFCTLLLFCNYGFHALGQIGQKHEQAPSVPGGPPGPPDNTPGSPCDPTDGVAAINAKRTELLAQGIQLGSPRQIRVALDNIGRYQLFSNNYAIFWSPNTCARLVHGAIYDKWTSMGRERSALRYPISDEMDMYDNRGHYSKFQGGFIVSTPNTGAHSLAGPIAQKWWELVERGRVGGFFPGYPMTDQQGSANASQWIDFEAGSIYWTAVTGAHEIHGPIRNLWLQLSPTGPDSWLGSPVTDGKLLFDASTAYQRFQNGIIRYDPRQANFVGEPNPPGNAYFEASRADLLFKEDIDFGKPVVPAIKSPVGYQVFLEGDNIIATAIERHRDGSIYIAYTPRTSPYWYDPYLPNDTAERARDGISLGHFGVRQFGLQDPESVCSSFKTPVPNLHLNHDYSTTTPDPDEYGSDLARFGTYDATCRQLPLLKARNAVVPWPKHEEALPEGWLPAPKWLQIHPRGGASTPPGDISDFPPYGLAHATSPFTGDRGAFCNYRDVATVKSQDQCTVPCENPCPPSFAPSGKDIWVPPEWATILPLNPGNIYDTSLGAKTYQGQLLTGQRLKQLEQVDPDGISNAIAFRGSPVRRDYCRGRVGWVSSDLEGLVTNSFLSGVDYSGSHVGYPVVNPSYWVGYREPRYFNSCSLEAKDSTCDDWIVYVQPDKEYQFLQLTDPKGGDGKYHGGNYNDEHLGSLENEIEQWLLPMGFRPEPGERIYMTGRWAVDCGHGDWHGELHPIESYVSTHLERVDSATLPLAIGGIRAVAKVVVTGDWPAYPNNLSNENWEGNYPLNLQLWAPPRPSATAILAFTKQAPPQGNFGLTITDSLLPPDAPNHVQVSVQSDNQETGFPRTHDYNQVFDPSTPDKPSNDGVRLTRRLAAIYYLWWEEPFQAQPFSSPH